MPYYRCPVCGLTSYSAASHSTAAACPSCSAALAANSRIHLVPGARHDLNWSLVAQPQAPAQARRVIGGLPLPEATRRTLALLVSELVTNSVLHARLAADDTVDLHVNNGHGQVRVAVHDGGAGFRIPTEPSDRLSDGGRGLVIAAALSDTWGVD